jgi:hypothetical protein
MRLDLRFSTRPLDTLWCQAVAALVFQGPSMARGVLSELNQKTAGYLARLVEKGLWSGERGENFLLAAQNMIKADKIIFHGMGPENEFDEEILEREVMDLGSRLDKIGVSDFGISVPVAEGLEKRYGSYLELSVIRLVDTFYSTHKEEPDFLLKIIFSVDSLFEGLLDLLINRLRDHFHPKMEFSIVKDGWGRF